MQEMLNFSSMHKFFTLDVLRIKEEEKELLMYESIGFTVFLYLVYMKNFHTKFLPMVYRTEAILLTAMPHILQLIKTSDPVKSFIGMDFLLYLLNNISSDEIEQKHTWYEHLSMGLSFVMIYGTDKNMRERSKQAFDELLDKLAIDAKYKLLCTVYDRTEHAGMEGYCIVLMNNILTRQYPENDLCKAIPALATKYTSFVPGETHVLQESDRILAGLNFVRFWYLRDPRSVNKTGIWDSVSSVEKNISVIQDCIAVSMQEFNRVTKGGIKGSDSNKLNEMMSIICGGQSFNRMSDDEQIKSLNKARCCLEMIASVIARIHEIVDSKP